MQILNKEANIRSDVCYRVTSEGKICDVNKDQVERIIAPFEELRKESKSVANIEDLGRANTLAREKRLIRVRKLEEEQRNQRNAGFALVGSITVIGTLVMGLIIFMAVKMIVLG